MAKALAEHDAPRPITLEEFMALDEPGRFDVIDGELVMAAAGIRHCGMSGEFTYWLRAFTREHGLGRVFTAEPGFLFSERPLVILVPDVAYIHPDRLLPREPEGFFRGAPDLAVEVISPSETPRAVERKVRRYLEAETRLVWRLYSERRTIAVHRSGDVTLILGPDDTLDGGDVLPGFALPLREVFGDA